MATLTFMAKRPKKSGKNVSPRQGIQFPKAWYEVAQKMALARRQPTTWFLVGLVEEAAKKDNITDLPILPWDEGYSASSAPKA